MQRVAYPSIVIVWHEAKYKRNVRGLPVNVMSNVEQLERLVRLRDSGVLDEREFQAEKAKILSGSGSPHIDDGFHHLWNPIAVANWSVLFTPIFGGYLLAKNWDSLGKKNLARRSMLWVVGGVIVLLVALANSGAVIFQFCYLVTWYFVSARSQAQYIKETLNSQYKKKGWLAPIVITLVIILVVSVFAETIDSERTGRPIPPESAYDTAKRLDYRAATLNDISKGELIVIEGKVLQVIGSRSARIGMGATMFGSGDDVYLEFREAPRIVDGDIVDVKGRYDGVITYKTVLGAARTIPRIKVDHYSVTRPRR